MLKPYIRTLELTLGQLAHVAPLWLLPMCGCGPEEPAGDGLTFL